MTDHLQVPADATVREAIRQLRTFLQLDDTWTTPHEDGFTWWAHQHAQRFRVEGPHDVGGEPAYWASFEAYAVRGLRDDDPALRNALNDLNHEGGLYTAVAHEGRLVLRARTSFTRRTSSRRTLLLAERAVIANVAAATKSSELTGLPRRYGRTLADAEPDRTAHPTSGMRAEPDDVLNWLDTWAAQAAAPLRPDRRPNLDTLATDCAAAGRRVSFDEHRTILHISGSEGDTAFNLALDLAVRHPVLGPGMIARLVIPLDRGLPWGTAAELSKRLNQAEWTTRVPLLGFGTWTVAISGLGKRHDLAFIRYRPHMTLEPRAGAEEVQDMAERVRWVDRWRVGVF